MTRTEPDVAPWPPLPLEAWRPTRDTLHMWAQMVGKTRLALAPPVNHWWHTPLYLTSRGLTTSPMPYHGMTLTVDFDFIDHMLLFRTSEGATRAMPLIPRSVADFFEEYTATLAALGVEPHIWPVPVEVEHPIPFAEDTTHASYDAEYANRFWRVLASTERVMQRYRGGFVGKSSPVQLWWGALDLAMARFSGRRAPEKPGLTPMEREAYSHEVFTTGFWTGSGAVPDAAFYAYAAPAPAGFADAAVEPGGAYFDTTLGEFILPYEAVRTAASPDDALLEFMQSSYAAAATLGGWDRAALEAPPPAAK